MDVLTLALYAEGSTDIHFLSSIIQRTSDAILARFAENLVGTSEPLIIAKKHGEDLEWCSTNARGSAFHTLQLHRSNIGQQSFFQIRVRQIVSKLQQGGMSRWQARNSY